MSGSRSGLFWGLVLLIVGAVWLLNNVGAVFFDFGEFIGRAWPVAIIIVGIWILVGSRQPSVVKGNPAAQRLSHGLGDLHMTPDRIDPEGLEVKVGAGEVKMDLTGTKLQDRENLVTVKIGFGDIEIRTPNNVPVFVNGRTGAGDLHLFGRDADGFAARLDFRDPDYELSARKLRIDLKAGLGDIRVERG